MAITLRKTKGTSLTHEELDANFTTLETDLETAETKLATIETGADVTDATNVAAATAVMEGDTTTAAMSFVIDEDDMVSDSPTKVPTQQSVKAYVDASGGGGLNNIVEDTTPQLGGDLDLNSNVITGMVLGTDVAAAGANSDITSITGLTTDLTVAQGGTGAGTFAADGILYGNGTGAIGATAVGTATHVLTSNGTGVPPTFQAAGTGITLSSAQATTSGTEKDFTVGAGAKRITIHYVGVSFSGTSNPLIQLGDAGGIESSGYLGAGFIVTGAPAINATSYTTGFGIASSGAANIFHGSVILNLQTGTTWVANGGLALSNAAQFAQTMGSKTLSAEITTVRITTVGGTDTFDAGSMSISYE